MPLPFVGWNLLQQNQCRVKTRTTKTDSFRGLLSIFDILGVSHQTATMRGSGGSQPLPVLFMVGSYF
jgi:hypothetical protein